MPSRVCPPMRSTGCIQGSALTTSLVREIPSQCVCRLLAPTQWHSLGTDCIPTQRFLSPPMAPPKSMVVDQSLILNRRHRVGAHISIHTSSFGQTKPCPIHPHNFIWMTSTPWHLQEAEIDVGGRLASFHICSTWDGNFHQLWWAPAQAQPLPHHF